MDDFDNIDFNEMNHTELVKLAQWLDMKGVTRAVPRDVIIKALEDLKPLDIKNPVDDLRDSLSKWMKRHWSVLEMQVRKSECPNCELCGDLQVIECHTDNKHHLK